MVNGNSTAILTFTDTYRRFLEHIQFYRKNPELCKQVDNLFMVVIQIGEETVFLQLTALQFSLLMILVYCLLGIVIGVILSLSVSFFKFLWNKFYKDSRLARFVIKIRGGTEEVVDEMIKIYFPKRGEVVYRLKMGRKFVKKILKKAIKLGAVTLGINKIAGNVIWISDHRLAMILLYELQGWQDWVQLITENIYFVQIFSAITESNIRTVAGIHLIGMSSMVTSALIVFELVQKRNMLITKALSFSGSGILAAVVAFIGAQNAPLTVVIRLVAVLSSRYGLADPVTLESLKPQFKPSYTKFNLQSEMKEFLETPEDVESNLPPDLIVLTGSDSALERFQNPTLGELEQTQAREGLRKRGLKRLKKVSEFARNRYRTMRDYWWPDDQSKLVEPIDPNNYYDPLNHEIYE